MAFYCNLAYDTLPRVVFEYGCPSTVLAVAIMLSPSVVANTFAKPSGGEDVI
jgi:hypothetical protein